jgi:hypothetical protein
MRSRGLRRNQKFANPFYGLLLVAGIAFALTATAYVVFAFRDARGPATANIEQQPGEERHPLMVWLNQHGETALMTELGLLAAFTVAAIATDDYWQRRNTASDT